MRYDGNEYFRQSLERIGLAIVIALDVRGECFLDPGLAVRGTIFNNSDTWQLVVNTATTIITYLAVFLIQNTQNRDTRSRTLKTGRVDQQH